jgi:hypothetical protein
MKIFFGLVRDGSKDTGVAIMEIFHYLAQKYLMKYKK